MRLRSFASIILILIFVSAFRLNAENTDTIPRISLITCHAGKDVYELCGHTAIRIQYNGSDDVVNYGLFDFDSPNFVYRFVKGETDYHVGAYPFAYFMREYCRDNRRVVEQQLNITSQQAWKIIELLSINLRPENRVYRYNYVKNNCATLPIGIIEKAIGDSIAFSAPTIPSSEEWSFRDEMKHFHRNYPWYQFGIDLALGVGLDYRLPLREKMFAPEALEQMMHGATITDSIGNEVPIVAETLILNNGDPNGAQLEPTPWYLTPMAACSLLFVIILAFTIRDIRRKKVSRWVDCVIFTLFGVMGCLLTFLIFVSVHEATSPNYLYVWLNPLCFIAAIAIWLKKCKSILICYHFINFVALLALIVAWYWLGQEANVAFIPLIACSIMRSFNYYYINKCAVKKIA